SALASAAAMSCSTPASPGAGSNGARSQTTSLAVRSVVVMSPRCSSGVGRYRSRASMHHQLASCEAGPLEEILGLAMTRQRRRVDAQAVRFHAERNQAFDDELPYPDGSCLGLDVD